MTTGELLVLIAACVLFQGFFSGSELALVSADRLRLESAARAGDAGAGLALKFLEKPAWILGTTLVGTNLCTITAGTLGALLADRLLGGNELFAILLIVPLTLLLGEMVPKAVYQSHADRLAPRVVFPLRTVAWVLTPFLWAIDRFSRLIRGDGEETAITREEIRLLLDASRDEAIRPEDKALIRRVFAFTEAVVRDVMVPLSEVVAVPAGATCAEAARRMEQSGHSRLPVFQERIDRVVGVVLHQDLLATADWTTPVDKVLRTTLFVPATKRVDELFAEMQRTQRRMAVAVDEYGGAVGILTAEDLLEEIVGEIQDESDRDRVLVRRVSDREWIAPGRATLEQVERAAGLHLPDGDYGTVAGYLLDALGHVPRVGEQVAVSGYVIAVLRADERAIREVAIRRR